VSARSCTKCSGSVLAEQTRCSSCGEPVAPPPELLVAHATHEAARFAVETWHYSRRMPMPPMIRYGVWERGAYVGCVLFARGASPTLGAKYGLTQEQSCELVRIALTKHRTPVSRIVAIALRMLRRDAPKLRLVVSFADPHEGHHGGIYQAGGWIYAGSSSEARQFFHNGRWRHVRAISSGAFGEGKSVDHTTLPSRVVPGKHRYLMPLDHELRRKIESLRQSAPRR
jgi:hypothetical protein